MIMRNIFLIVLSVLVSSNAFAVSTIRALGAPNAKPAATTAPVSNKTTTAAPIARKASMITPVKPVAKTANATLNTNAGSADANRLSLVPIKKTGADQKFSTKLNSGSGVPIATSDDVSSLSDKVDALEQRISLLTRDFDGLNDSKQDRLVVQTTGSGPVIKSISIEGSVITVENGETSVSIVDSNGRPTGQVAELGFELD